MLLLVLADDVDEIAMLTRYGCLLDAAALQQKLKTSALLRFLWFPIHHKIGQESKQTNSVIVPAA